MLFGRNLDTGLPAAVDDDHWRQVLQQLELTDSQVGLCLYIAFAASC
jgi:hypothetical protein